MHNIALAANPGATMDQLEVEIAKLPEVALHVEHLFAHKTYARVLHIPAGTVLTGKEHRHATINILLKGRIRISATNEEPRDMEAPAIFVSQPGCRRAGLAIEDTIWVNVHGTEETDLEKIEAEHIVPHVNPMLDYTTRRITP